MTGRLAACWDFFTQFQTSFDETFRQRPKQIINICNTDKQYILQAAGEFGCHGLCQQSGLGRKKIELLTQGCEATVKVWFEKLPVL